MNPEDKRRLSVYPHVEVEPTADVCPSGPSRDAGDQGRDGRIIRAGSRSEPARQGRGRGRSVYSGHGNGPPAHPRKDRPIRPAEARRRPGERRRSMRTTSPLPRQIARAGVISPAHPSVRKPLLKVKRRIGTNGAAGQAPRGRVGRASTRQTAIHRRSRGVATTSTARSLGARVRRVLGRGERHRGRGLRPREYGLRGRTRTSDRSSDTPARSLEPCPCT